MPELLSQSPPVAEDDNVLPEFTDVMQMLRIRTADSHQRLESAVDLMRSITSTDRYAGLLVKFATLHQRLDDEVVAQIAGQDHRRKLPLLRSDLETLERSMPDPTSSFEFDSLASRIGAMYVTEGSTLGGQVISRHVRETLPPGTPTAYFSSYGSDTARQWNGFRALARRTLRDDTAAAAALDGAAAVFQRFIEVLS
jgi:heme oxygenase